MSTFSEANRKAFNDLSASYHSKPWQQKLTQQVADGLQKRKDWIGIDWAKPDDYPGRTDVRLLDYACGTGAITQALGPWVNTIRGIDVSENMVKLYNEAAQGSGLTTEQAHAVAGDLLADEIPAELQTAAWYNFDLIVIGLGFHHFDDPARAIKQLSERLKPGSGVLVIIDFLPGSSSSARPADAAPASDFPDMAHTIKHDGFDGPTMMTFYAQAGLQKGAFEVLDEPVVMELQSGVKERTLFFAKANRAPTALSKVGAWMWGMIGSIGGQIEVHRTDQVPYQHSRVDQQRYTGGL